ncbi:glycosyltransferase family 2 protein [Rubritalea spongiae]|uniref:Glycosyltransferase family 2 protein n=1 Tax=Rubritalea spongiae TaxID=430797 RepID=A0ABW5E0S4_9BACT
MFETDSKVWIVIPVHNRVDITRECLKNLEVLQIKGKYNVLVVDDGSSDGTEEMINVGYPWVYVLKGDGSLFWGGAISIGMDYAVKRGAEVIVWLNDDCLPQDDSIKLLVNRVKTSKGVCGGVCWDDSVTEVTYSGYKKKVCGKMQLRPEDGMRLEADFLGGNLVAIHASVIRQIGLLDSSEFQHYFADAWYTWKAKQSGASVEVDGSAIAINESSNYFDRIGVSLSALDAWKSLWKKGSPANLNDRFRFRKNVWGALYALSSFKIILVMVKYTFVAYTRGGVRGLFLIR